MSSFPDAAQEPRKVFLTLLITTVAGIKQELYNGRAAQRATLELMCGLIDILDEHSQKKLEHIYDTLVKYREGKTYLKHDITNLFSEICIYLHKTYLQEVNLGIVPAASLPTKEKAPEPKIYSKQLDARL